MSTGQLWIASRLKSDYATTMSTQEILLEEIRHQPEPVLRQLRQYLEFLKRQQEVPSPMEDIVADTWEKLGPAPEINYDRI